MTVETGIAAAVRERCRRHKSRVEYAITAREEIAKLFERSPVQRPGTNERCWGQHFDWSPSQYGIYGASAGIQVLLAAGRAPSIPLLREARAVLDSIEDPTGRFQGQRDHLNVYKLAFCVEAVYAPSNNATTGPAPAALRLIEAALPSGGWPDYRCQPSEEPDATELATATALYALRRYDVFPTLPECRLGLQLIIGRRSGHVLNDSLQGPTVLGYDFLALNSYRDLPVSKGIEEYSATIRQLEKALTRWTKRRSRRELFDQFRYDFVERPSATATRDSDFIALMPDCIVAIAYMQAPNHLNAARRRHVIRIVDGIIYGVKSQDFRPRNVDKRSTVDHLWAQRVLSNFLKPEVQAAFRRRHRVRVASSSSFWSQLMITLATSGIATWASLAKVDTFVGDAVLLTVAALAGGLAVEMLAGRFLK